MAPHVDAGYSGTPLLKKLGVKDDSRVAVLNEPSGFQGFAGVDTSSALRGKFDVLVFFTTSRADFEKRLPALRKAMEPAAGLWIAWPKKASGVTTDMTENVVRDVALPTGLVDNKVCAVDDTWSGLRLVIRKELR
ncbi:MAG: DUF3052 domain-containing protein [Actinobacteria bacterium]|nr:DUF3052 domain-containing protein [Actinomycetota bacterium]